MNDRMPGLIGRIRPKSGGELRVVPRNKHAVRDSAVAALEESVDWVRESYPEDLAGYALVVWDHSMNRSDMSFVAVNSPIRSWYLPHWVFANLLQRQVEGEVDNAVRGWLE